METLTVNIKRQSAHYAGNEEVYCISIDGMLPFYANRTTGKFNSLQLINTEMTTENLDIVTALMRLCLAILQTTAKVEDEALVVNSGLDIVSYHAHLSKRSKVWAKI